MKKHIATQFLKKFSLWVFGIGFVSVLYAQLSIPSHIDNAVQTIGKIVLTQDGTAVRPDNPAIVTIDSNSATPFVVTDTGGQTAMTVDANGNVSSSDTTKNNPNKIVGAGSLSVGGYGNDIQGDSSVSVGSNKSKIQGFQSAIIGGLNNTINAEQSFIVGGFGNIIAKIHSAIISSLSGVINGEKSVIIGGSDNRVDGDNSTAGGRYAQSLHNSTWVWSDYDDSYDPVEFSSTKSNTFLIRALNGVGINTNTPTDNASGKQALTVNGVVGATKYCDIDGANCILPSNVSPAEKDPTTRGLSDNYLPKWNGTGFVNSRVSDTGAYVTITSSIKSPGFWAKGEGVTANGIYATAMGYNTQANGENSIAMGKDTISAGIGSFAAGYQTVSQGTDSFAIGGETQAKGDYSTSMGQKTLANGHYSTAMGAGTKALGDESVAMGGSTIASGYNSVAMGASTQALGMGSLAVGFKTIAQGKDTFAIGSETQANGDYSVAIGKNTKAIGVSSIAMGESSIANGYASFALGGLYNGTEYNIAGGDYSVVLGGFGNRSSGLRSLSAGWYSIAEGEGAIAMGASPQAIGPRSVAIGASTKALGSRSLAMGLDTIASGYASTAFGRATKANGGESTAMGYMTIANGTRSLAMGELTQANGDYSTAMGNSTQANGDYSTAMGYYANANGSYSTAMGQSTQANGNYSTVIGKFNLGLTNSLFEIGMGPNGGSRANALTVYADGRVVAPVSIETPTLIVDKLVNRTVTNITVSGQLLPDPAAPAASQTIGSSTSGWKALYAGGINALSDGRVGIGTPSVDGSVKLQVAGAIKSTTKVQSPAYCDVNGSNCFTASSITSPTLVVGANYVAKSNGSSLENSEIYDNGTTVAIGNTSSDPTLKLRVSGNIKASGYFYDSDITLKKDIKSLDNALAKINQLNGYSFSWKSNDQKDIGVIAQEVEKVFPEIVHTNPQGIKSVEYANLVAPIIEAIKSLTNKIDDLFNKYLNQEARINALEQRVQALESYK